MHERERAGSWYFQCWSRRDSSMAVTPWGDLISSPSQRQRLDASQRSHSNLLFDLRQSQLTRLRESRRGELGVLPYLKQRRKLNFLVGKNIQLWLANLQTRCKHVVCCLWAVRAVLVLTVSIKLETLPEVRHYLIDLSRCEPIDTAESQLHLAFTSCHLPIFKVGDIKFSGILLQNTDRLELFSRARDPHHTTAEHSTELWTVRNVTKPVDVSCQV